MAARRTPAHTETDAATTPVMESTVDDRPAIGSKITESVEREVKVDDYPERPYAVAMTSEQKQALKDVGLL